MSNIYKKFTEAIKNLSLSFTRESLLAGFFFSLVLCSWYVLRPVRNEMAVQNSDILPYLLGIGALVMLVLNPVYSWLASRKNLRGPERALQITGAASNWEIALKTPLFLVKYPILPKLTLKFRILAQNRSYLPTPSQPFAGVLAEVWKKSAQKKFCLP